MSQAVAVVYKAVELRPGDIEFQGYHITGNKSAETDDGTLDVNDPRVVLWYVISENQSEVCVEQIAHDLWLDSLDEKNPQPLEKCLKKYLKKAREWMASPYFDTFEGDETFERYDKRDDPRDQYEGRHSE